MWLLSIDVFAGKRGYGSTPFSWVTSISISSGEYTLPTVLPFRGLLFTLPTLTPAALHFAIDSSGFRTPNPIWSTTDPRLPAEGDPGVRKMKTPGNFTTSVPSIFIGVPPRIIQNLFVASTSRTTVCQWPSATPASLGARSCAQQVHDRYRSARLSIENSLFTCLSVLI